ncbi:MAG: Rieske (2Fe-2S) domain protein [Acidobacteria bacterium]|nr:Rieske (2Fe-2S) domain protein [Acidobacteriota bacterium]
MASAPEELFKAIDRQEWLDDLAEPLQKGIHELFGEQGRSLKDLLHGTWLGHPLHPVLTDIPVGAWTVAAVLDVVESTTGNEAIGKAADAAVAIGLAGAIGSAITGITDWSETYDRPRRIGLTHGILNLVATGLYATSLALRLTGGSRSTATTLSHLGYAISGASAYLGGHLVFGEQIGVDHTATADATKPEKYTPVLAESDLPESKPTRVVAEGVAIVLVRKGSRIHALTDTCPHLGGPLSEGKIVGGAIQCPWHQSQLALEDGHVVCGPTTFPARAFDVRTTNGQIEVRAATKQADS